MTIEPTESVIRQLKVLLELARREDLGDGDVTASLIAADAVACGRFTARQDLIVCGSAMLAEIARAYDEAIQTEVLIADGQRASAGQRIALWTGPARSFLSAERVALNFLQHLSGIATETGRYVQVVEGTNAAIYDTRKTTPAWRELEKYAVRCGGGRNHRMGLHDAVLVKDNHLAILAATGESDPVATIASGFKTARTALGPNGFVEMEVDTLEQLAIALTLDVDIVLLDNMDARQMLEAVAIRDASAGEKRILLEASGGITLETAALAGRTGVDRISVGSITHSAPAVDIGLDMDLV